MLKIRNLSVHLESFKLSNINLDVKRGAYFVIAGPSGSGKTILLEALAGIYKIEESGTVLMNGSDVSRKKIQERNIGLVFQDNTLFPHFSVQKNIEFALRLKHSKEESDKKLKHICEQLFLWDLLHRNPDSLSGGEIQRVLLARTLASSPEVILLDEPLSAVDTNQKDQLKSLLRSLHRSGQTIIHVTHDFEEAFSLATNIGIMHNGEILDTGTPEEIIDFPRNKFVARFCGYKNYFEAERMDEGFSKIQNKIIMKPPCSEKQNGKLAIVIDETKILLFSHGDPDQANTFKGTIKDSFKSLKGVELSIDIGLELSVIIPGALSQHKHIRIDEELWVHIPDEAFKIISH